MPRVLINVSDAWLNRLQTVIPSAIDTLQGLQHQIQTCLTEGTPEPEHLLEQLQSQIIDLRRNIEAIRIIF